MRVELIAKHRELRRGRLRLEPDHAVVLFLELEEIIDREIERSEEHTSELQSLMRTSYAVICLKKKIVTEMPNTRLKYRNKNAYQKKSYTTRKKKTYKQM